MAISYYPLQNIYRIIINGNQIVYLSVIDKKSIKKSWLYEDLGLKITIQFIVSIYSE